MEFVPLSPAHNDVINDIAFDYYGKRFATCGNDKEIKIWDLQPETDSTMRWQSYSMPSAHTDAIWRVSWAHPEFGQLFSSCSQDGNVHIWEEQESVTTARGEGRGKWTRKVQLLDSKRSVNDVKFAPRHLGLKLAAGSADGMVRIYEATDVFALNYW
jgi:WD40 repeat protein